MQGRATTSSGSPSSWPRISRIAARQHTNRCTVVGMWLAGIPLADNAVLWLAASLREAELVDTAERLERAYDREARIVALDVPDREAILRVLQDCPRGDAGAAGDATPGARLAATRGARLAGTAVSRPSPRCPSPVTRAVTTRRRRALQSAVSARTAGLSPGFCRCPLA